MADKMMDGQDSYYAEGWLDSAWCFLYWWGRKRWNGQSKQVIEEEEEEERERDEIRRKKYAPLIFSFTKMDYFCMWIN